MADNDIELFSSYVWGETGGLTAQGSEPEKTQDRLWSVLAFIATKARPRGLLGQMKRAGSSVSADETANYTRMKDAVQKVAEGKYDNVIPLPQQAALWQIDTAGRLLFNPGDASRTPPPWIFLESARQAGEFSNKAGQRFRLFELVDPPAAGQLGYVSSYSSTGLTIRTWTVPARTRKIAWVLGIAASILFVLGGISATRSGRTDGSARTQMTGPEVQYGIVDKLARNCVQDQKLFPKWKRGACGFLDEDAGGKYIMPAALADPQTQPPAAATKPEPTAAAKPEAAATKPETETAAKPESGTAAKPETGAVAKPETGAAAKNETAVAAKPEPAATTKSGATAAGKPEPAKPESAAAAAKTVTLYGPRVGETIGLIRKCLNIGFAPAPADTKPAAPDADAAAAAAAADEAASCQLVARSAGDLVTVTLRTSFLDNMAAMAMGVRSMPGKRSILLQLLCTTLGIVGLAIALGLGTKGRVDGIWIDERNRVSLARAQVTLWTIVALGGFATIALFNIGLGAPVAFPQIPASIAAALGIAFASPMISALILNSSALKSTATPLHDITVGGSANDTRDFANRGAFLAAPPSAIETREDPTMASIADVFVGEQVSDAANVDISRLQNVILTVTLVLGYFAMLTEQLRAITPEGILSGLASLPDPGAAFTAVLLVSHATYLGTKVYKAAPGAGETDQH